MSKGGFFNKYFVKDKDFYKVLLSLAIPVVLQNMITIGVNIMDTVMLGSYGEIQLSASSLANNFIEIYHILNLGIGGGGAVLIAQYWGAKDNLGVKRVISIMFRITLIAAVLFTVVAYLFPSWIISLYSPETEVIEKGRLYLLWSLPTFFLQGCTLAMTLSLRPMRKVKVPFIASIISFFVNIFFNWVFIFGNLGAPEMQIAGAALGTVIARVVEFLVIGIYFFLIEKDVSFKVKDIFVRSREEIGRFFQYGAPVIVSDLLLVAGTNCISSIMGHIGSSFVAAYSIIAPIMRLCNVFTAGMAQASGTMVGNVLGTGDKEGAQRYGVTFLLLSLCTGLFAGIVLYLAGPFIVGFYNITAETQGIAMNLLYAVDIMIIFQSVQTVLTKGVLRGGGDTKFMMVADALFLWILSVPLGYMCGLVWGFGPFVIYIALRSDFIVKSLWCTKRLFSKKWIKRIKTEGDIK
ncbi:MAG: MATE family efflux transporter [Sphaerochaetaceae bacterium]|nr:MATE family efflux transporter [Sphaerochaetaceae bacterium]